MVTIEQKLALFSKLLHQDIKNNIDEEVEKLSKEYENKVDQHKARIDKQGTTLIEQSIKRAEMKKVEMISRSKIFSKKEEMLTKEKLIDTFMERLKNRIRDFTQTTEYEKYLLNSTKAFIPFAQSINPLTVYLTKQDSIRYAQKIAMQLENIGISKDLLSFEEKEDNMLGGIMIEEKGSNTRIDMSVAMQLEEAKEHMIERLFEELAKAGEMLE